MGERFKFRHVNAITGAFVLVVVAVLIATVMWTGHSQRWFRGRVTLRIILPEAGAAGIRQGSEVYFLGTLVGSVSDVIVDTTGRMEAEANIRRDFFRFVRADSSAAVKKKFGVAGDSFFEITRGQGKPLPEKNASIVCNEQFQSPLESAIEEIRRDTLLVLKKTSTGLDTWTQLGADLGETRQHLDQLTGRLEKMAAGVEAGDERRALVGLEANRLGEHQPHREAVARGRRECGRHHLFPLFRGGGAAALHRVPGARRPQARLLLGRGLRRLRAAHLPRRGQDRALHQRQGGGEALRAGRLVGPGAVLLRAGGAAGEAGRRHLDAPIPADRWHRALSLLRHRRRPGSDANLRT